MFKQWVSAAKLGAKRWLALLEVDGRHPHMICSSYKCYCGDNCGGIDECGNWQRLDRHSSEDHLSAQLGIVDFLEAMFNRLRVQVNFVQVLAGKDIEDVQPLS